MLSVRHAVIEWPARYEATGCCELRADIARPGSEPTAAIRFVWRHAGHAMGGLLATRHAPHRSECPRRDHRARPLAQRCGQQSAAVVRRRAGARSL